MDLIGSRRKRQQKTIVSDSLRDSYHRNLHLYSDQPVCTIPLSEFEDLALERLRVLRVLEQANQKGHKIYSNDWKECIYSDLIKQNLKKYYRLITFTGAGNPTEADLQARRADHVSHFILRLAYCRSDELRKWFLARELELFRLRFLELTPKCIEQFLAENNLTYTPISSEEKTQLHDELFQSTASVYVIDAVDFYKVPYTEVINLVKNKKVYVEKGFAYIPSYELVTCVLGIFRSSLNESLVYFNQRLPEMDDDRINLLISNLHHLYTGRSYEARTDGATINPASIDAYSRQHFPLCMKHIHGILRSTHHLKHGCRMQYGLFLKGIGLSYEDAMNFFREEFTKLIDGDKFDRQYAYNIKHNYGKVGRMVSYTPYTCIGIINGSVGPGEHHGCPFKQWDATALRAKLTESGVGSAGIQDIVETATKGHYQVACFKYYEHTHAEPNKNVINHPNQYFEDSFNMSKGKEKDQNKAKPATKVKSTDDSSMKIDDIDWDEEM